MLLDVRATFNSWYLWPNWAGARHIWGKYYVVFSAIFWVLFTQFPQILVSIPVFHPVVARKRPSHFVRRRQLRFYLSVAFFRASGAKSSGLQSKQRVIFMLRDERGATLTQGYTLEERARFSFEYLALNHARFVWTLASMGSRDVSVGRKL